MNAGDDLLARARATHAEGRLDEAERLYRMAAEAAPGSAAPPIGIATIALQRGRAPEALQAARILADAHPGLADAHMILAAAMQADGKGKEAVTAYQDAAVLDPGHAGAWYGLADSLHRLERLEDAEAFYRRALSLDVDYAEAGHGLGSVTLALGRPAEAAEAFARALEIDPDYTEAGLGLAASLLALGRAEEAEAAYRWIEDTAPEHRVAASAGRGAALLAAGQHPAALDALEAALGSAPDAALLHRQRGLVLAELGRLDEADAALRAALAKAPGAATYRELANCRRIRPGDPVLGAMKERAAGEAALPLDERVQIHFALGRALTDTGDPEAVFASLLAGNALHRARVRYDEQATLLLLDRIETAFSREVLRTRARDGVKGAAPIFIVGMPRSGSTLIEQMLASHPGVAAGGERPDFGAAVRAAGADTSASPYPESIAGLDPSALCALGADYIARVAAPPGKRPTDKMLANALFVGLIHCALPGARIVHARRDPVDTCLSCFAELFANDVPFAYDLGELGRFCRAQTRLMDHWRRALPQGVMLDVDYEAMVADPEGGARRLLDHCGLGWDSAVLRFHENRRPVRTASFAQVRRPVYRASAGRWRPEDAVLRPLLDGLAGEG